MRETPTFGPLGIGSGRTAVFTAENVVGASNVFAPRRDSAERIFGDEAGFKCSCDLGAIALAHNAPTSLGEA